MKRITLKKSAWIIRRGQCNTGVIMQEHGNGWLAVKLDNGDTKNVRRCFVVIHKNHGVTQG